MHDVTNILKEYGGYLELETIAGEEFYPDLHKFNLARTALVWLLEHIEHDRVFIPEFICHTVIEAAETAGNKVVLYNTDKQLRPSWGHAGTPKDSDVLYIVNYYGQLSETDIKNYRDTFNTVVVDNAQAFYERPIDGVHTIYSLRKFFGVADGAYLASDINVSTKDLPLDLTGNRADYLLGRLEESANEYYREAKAAEDGFSNEAPKRMSLFTQNIIKGIDYESVKQKRCSNYKLLHELLESDNPFTKNTPRCPYAYPYYHEDGVNLRQYLVDNKIYIPTLWAELIRDNNINSLEHEWSANILCLPIDQRYEAEDMRHIAKVILDYNK